jgi:hypothetical protein
MVKTHMGHDNSAFHLNRHEPVHRWVPWIAGFSAPFVRHLLDTEIKTPGVVLDPFCGVGTALIEAARRGHQTIGVEINPYAAFASRLKLEAFHHDPSQLTRLRERFLEFYTRCLQGCYVARSCSPAGFRTRLPFYSPKVLHKVLVVQDFINTIREWWARDMFRLAFAAVMVEFSNYSCESSLSTQPAGGKSQVEDFPVDISLANKLNEMAADITWLQTTSSPQNTRSPVWNMSFVHIHDIIPPESIDTVITSPPYLNNYHYGRHTRPQLYWLGYVTRTADLNRLDRDSFGKTWQQVRKSRIIPLQFQLPGSDLPDLLDALRKTSPERGTYSGNGWANYATTWFNDGWRMLQLLLRSLKPGGTVWMVLGNSILQGVPIAVDRYMTEMASALGWEVTGIQPLCQTRGGNSIIDSRLGPKPPAPEITLYESVIQLKKTSGSRCPSPSLNHHLSQYWPPEGSFPVFHSEPSSGNTRFNTLSFAADNCPTHELPLRPFSG